MPSKFHPPLVKKKKTKALTNPFQNWRVADAPSDAPQPSATTPGCCCCCCTAPPTPLPAAAAATAAIAAAAVAELVLATDAMLPPPVAKAAGPPAPAAAAEAMVMDDRGPLVALVGAPPADVLPVAPSIKLLVLLILYRHKQRRTGFASNMQRCTSSAFSSLCQHSHRPTGLNCILLSNSNTACQLELRATALQHRL